MQAISLLLLQERGIGVTKNLKQEAKQARQEVLLRRDRKGIAHTSKVPVVLLTVCTERSLQLLCMDVMHVCNAMRPLKVLAQQKAGKQDMVGSFMRW